MKDYIRAMYPGRSIQCKQIQCQPDNQMCGYFAMANSVIIALQQNPSDVSYNISEIREHAG